MPAAAPTILATSIGFNRAGTPWQPGPIFRYAFDLAGASTEPRLCLLATAGGDQELTIERCSAAFAGSGIRVSHLALFDKPNVPDVAAHLHAQDVIWVDRGSLVNLLAVWRAHGLDAILRGCWRAGVVLAGESAGSLCWFAGATTDSFGPVRGLRDGLGFLPYANAVHYAERRALFQQLVGDGSLPTGYATDAGAGLHYEGTTLVAAIADRRNAGAYRVERQPDGSVNEEPLQVTRLRR
ncbi:MAG: peptidase E [Actinobacteria bacterium]|nr:peptidase E [Actinomycetota bacterium]